MNTNYDPKRMVWRDPEGRYIVLLDHVLYLCDDLKTIGSFWSTDESKALHYKSYEDAYHVATGLVLRKTVLQGKPVYSIDNDGNVVSRLSVSRDS